MLWSSTKAFWSVLYGPQSILSSPYELKPGEQVLVKSMSGSAAKWHRARVNNIQSIEYGTVAIQFIDYGTNEVVHFSQVGTGVVCAGGAVGDEASDGGMASPVP